MYPGPIYRLKLYDSTPPTPNPQLKRGRRFASLGQEHERGQRRVYEESFGEVHYQCSSIFERP